MIVDADERWDQIAKARREEDGKRVRRTSTEHSVSVGRHVQCTGVANQRRVQLGDYRHILLVTLFRRRELLLEEH